MNRDLDYVLNYMCKYTKDRFMQDSEPMLNHKDIELVLKYIYELQQKIDKAIEYIERNCLEFNIKYACQGLNNDKVDYLLDILRGEDNE